MSYQSGHLRTFVLVLSLAALVSISIATSAGAGRASRRPALDTVSGRVLTGEAPIERSAVTLYRTPATPLAFTKSDANGEFTLSYREVTDPEAVLYVIARGGRAELDGPGATELPRGLALAAGLGTVPVAPQIVVNERTTVATAYALAQFIGRSTIRGSEPGLQVAAAMVNHLADVETGDVSATLATAPNGTETSALSTFNTLANMVAACAVDAANCTQLFDLVDPPRGPRPRDTFRAVAELARQPAPDNAATVGPLYELSQTPLPTRYVPDLGGPPDAWTLFLKFEGNGHQINGPGNIAIDADGLVWFNNNYTWAPTDDGPVCASHAMFRLDPTIVSPAGANVTEYRGGGLSGAGYGITIDHTGDVWIANFGFTGTTCPLALPPSNSVTQFRPTTGQFLSPAAGWTQGPLDWPQGMASDQHGSIWVANCASNSITIYRDGSPDRSEVVGGGGLLLKPWDVAIDGTGSAWVTANDGNAVFAYANDGTALPGSPYTDGGITRPMGVAVDSRSNVWISSSGSARTPCDGTTPQIDFSDSSPPVGGVVMLRPNGVPLQSSVFSGGGLTVPWGIAVDGDDNVWVANFSGQRVSHVCGARPENCPPGAETGGALPPDTGYGFDGLQRNTGIQIDGAGNAWITNNWKQVAVQTNPGGDGVVVMVGVAAPIKTPLIGAPEQP